jgi:hypothetical protein
VTQSPNTLELSLGLVKVSWALTATEKMYQFTCSTWIGGKWCPLEGSVFTTGLPEDTELGVLLAASRRIIDLLEEKGVGYFRAKPSEYVPALELLSWMNPDHFADRYVLENQNETYD